MSLIKYQRAAQRAPLRTVTLYEKDLLVKKGQLENISQTGLLLKNISDINVEEEISLMIKLTNFPIFQNLSVRNTSEIQSDLLSSSIFRAMGRVVRITPKSSGVEVGVKFFNLNDNVSDAIVEYIDLYGQNIIFLLSLFEQIAENEQCLDMVRKLASLMGYKSQERIGILRQKILHDYQNLES